MERLQKFLSECGVASRRKSEDLILQGKVKVNGEVITSLGVKVNPKDQITVDDVEIKAQEKIYYLLNKPEKMICSVHDEKGRKTVIDLIDTKEKIFPVGRLDYDTTGLLIITNDGYLSNKLMHPSSSINKTYFVKSEGIITSVEIKRLEDGIIIDGKKTSKSKAKIIKIDKKNNKSYIELTICEGRNHQVKKMLLAIGHRVVKLKRTKYSFLTLDNLKKGEYRSLSLKEIKKLYSIIK